MKSKNIFDSAYFYVIAEVGVNHEGSLDKAKELIEAAKEGGANAVKFQTYKAESLAAKDALSYWDTSAEIIKNQYDLFKKYDVFNESDYQTLSEYCNQLEIEFCSTPFDLNSVEILNPLVNFFKIASADITNFPLIKAIASKGKPIVLSTGASTIGEIRAALNQIVRKNKSEICLMHCILNYPTRNQDANLSMIRGIEREFPGYLLGYSDHTKPDEDMTILTTSAALGARVIEKHFTLDKNLSGNDHYHSMDLSDLKKFISNLKLLEEILGVDTKTFLESEEPARLYARRSIHFAKDLKKGDLVKANDFICLRPAFGISPIYIDSLIGKKLRYDRQKLVRVELSDFET